MSESSGNNSQQSAESLLSKELFSYCNSDSLSKEGLHEIIERHDYKNRQLSDYEFFLRACINERVNEEIIRCLLEYFPAAARATDDIGQPPLQFACCNKHVTVNMIQLLIDAAPNSVRSVNSLGRTPLHFLCRNKTLDEAAALEILELLIEKCPEAIRHATNDCGFLPIHRAAGWGRRSTEFYRLLIEAYPGSERITDVNGNLPLHYACMTNTLAIVEYFYKLYPDAINHTTTDGYYPIHFAIMGVIKKRKRASPLDSVDIVKFLLDSDPNVTLQKVDGESLLKWACRKRYNDSTIAAALEMIKIIYDAYPEAIEDDPIASEIQRYHQQVQSFLNGELVYSRQAKDHRLMTTPDGNGHLPLRTALQNNVRLGSIKLLVKGNPLAVQSHDNSGAIPLHVACAYHDSVNVVQYLVGIDATTLEAVDRKGNTALHIACHRARHEIIVALLGEYDAVSVSKRNAEKKLPIDLLWESSLVPDRESVEYTETVYRLLRAYPEMVMNNIDMQKHRADLALGSCTSQDGKKRKFGHD